MKIQQQITNAFARKNHHSRATKITIDVTATEPRLGQVIRYGYRKRSNGAYVSNAYRSHFGWKNTYYQRAIVEVILPA